MYRGPKILTLAVLALVSCSKVVPDNEVEMRFRAGISPEMNVLVKDGEVQAEPVIADHAVLQAWQGDVKAAEVNQSITAGTTQINFNGVKLAGGVTYDIYIWVGCDDYYNTSDLRNVSVNEEYNGKSSEFDAFYCYSTVTCGQNDGVHQVELKRPFAKVSFSAQVNSQLNVKFIAPTTFNLKTGEVSGERNVDYTVDSDGASVTAFDYIFATEDVSQLSYTFKLGEEEKTTSVPVKRNTKTNIIYNTATN